MQTPRERDAYLRVIPDPMPDHLELVVHWKDQMHISIQVRLKNPPTTPVTAELPPALPSGHPEVDPESPAALAAVRRQEASGRFKELVKLTRSELIVIAAKQGLRLASSLTVAVMAARIVDHEEKAKTEMLAPPKEPPAQAWRPVLPTPKALKEEPTEPSESKAA